MPWPFYEYDRIAEKPEKWSLDEAAYRAIQKARWIVTEKIHGANVSFVTDGKRLRCAKRKSFLAPDEDFYGVYEVAQRLEETLFSLFAALKEEYPDLIRIAVYGELFGGGYPHPEVAPVLGVQPIQTGVYYCPQIEFCAFDLAVERPTRSFLPFEEALTFFKNAALFCAEPLFTGSYEEALAYPIGFLSTIPKRLNLPPLEANKAEGIVLKPNEPLYMETEQGKARIIIKKKIPEFKEEKFFEAQKWSEPKGELTPLDLLSAALPGLATFNRLQSARSKIGLATDSKRATQIFLLFVDDILLQLEEDYPELCKPLTPREKRTLRRRAEEAARSALTPK